MKCVRTLGDLFEQGRQ